MKTFRKRTGKKKAMLNEPDEFLSLTQRAMNYVKDNANKAYAAAGILGLIAILAVGVNLWLDRSRSQVMAKEAEALKFYDIENPAPGSKPMEPMERMKKARELFGEIVKDEGGTKGADIALYYKANSAMSMGEVDPAITEYKELLAKSEGNAVLGTLARMRLARAYLLKGNTQDAIAAYMSEYKSRDGMLKDEALFRLGEIYEGMGKTTEAMIEYKKLDKEFPNSPYAQEAKVKIIKLGGAPGPQAGTAPGQPGSAQFPVKAEPAKPAPPAKVK